MRIRLHVFAEDFETGSYSSLTGGNVVKRRWRTHAPALDLLELRMHACYPTPAAQYRDHSWRTLSRLLLGLLD